MPRVPRIKPKLESLIERIGEVRLESSRALGILPEVRELLGIDAAIFFRLVRHVQGWAIEGFESDGLPDAKRFRRALNAVFGVEPALPWLDLANTNPAHRNTAVCVTAEVPEAVVQSSEMAERLIGPDTRKPHVLRVLLYEGDALRGWIGGHSMEPITETQLSMLQALVSPLLVRMRIERSLSAAPRLHAGLEQVLQYVRAPALIIDTRARVHATNPAADELLASKREQAMATIAAMMEMRTRSSELMLVPAGISDGSEQFLAIWAARSDDERLEQAAALAGLRWQLTPREVRVLKILVEGRPVAALARELELSESEADQHIKAILIRAQLTNRAQLVAAVLG